MPPKAPVRRQRPAGRRDAPLASEPQTVTIDSVGGQGDGIASLGGRRLYVPRTVAGDVVRVAVQRGNTDGDRGSLLEIVSPGPARVVAPCPHFDRCGGCSVQHLSPDAYGAWKLGLLHHALERAGLGTAAIAPLYSVPPGSRRRARFAAIKRGRKLFLGFNEAMSRSVVDLDACPVLVPAIVALLEPLRVELDHWLHDRESCDVAVTALDSGLDVLLIGPNQLDLEARERLAALAETADLSRLSWQADERSPAEPLAHRRPAVMSLGNVAVVPPPGGFLQAASLGEQHSQRAVLDGVGGALRVADLFCGIGTFTFPLTDNSARRITAVDGDGAAIAALEAAAHGAMRSGVTPLRRDLFRDPLTTKELAGFDVAVLDPPRAGASAQARELAASSVPTVVMVSCSPASFARDAHTLVDGGYRLVGVQPVDQFLWSSHLEVVGTFRRV